MASTQWFVVFVAFLMLFANTAVSASEVNGGEWAIEGPAGIRFRAAGGELAEFRAHIAYAFSGATQTCVLILGGPLRFLLCASEGQPMALANMGGSSLGLERGRVVAGRLYVDVMTTTSMMQVEINGLLADGCIPIEGGVGGCVPNELLIVPASDGGKASTNIRVELAPGSTPLSVEHATVESLVGAQFGGKALVRSEPGSIQLIWEAERALVLGSDAILASAYFSHGPVDHHEFTIDGPHGRSSADAFLAFPAPPGRYDVRLTMATLGVSHGSRPVLLAVDLTHATRITLSVDDDGRIERSR